MCECSHIVCQLVSEICMFKSDVHLSVRSESVLSWLDKTWEICDSSFLV